MGRPKLLLPWGDTTLVGAVVQTLAAAGVERTLLVASPEREDLQRWAHRSGVELAVNPDPDRGMLSSIWAGLEALGGADRLAEKGFGVLISPADLPSVRIETVRRLLDDARASNPAVPVFEGRRGHPLWIPPRLVGAVMALDLDVGLRQLLDRFPYDRIAVEDPGIRLDIDTPEQYQRLRP